MEMRDFAGKSYRGFQGDEFRVASSFCSSFVGDAAGKRTALDQRCDQLVDVISRDSSARADKVETENGRVNLADCFSIEVAGIKSKGDAELPGVFPELSWAAAIDEGANFKGPGESW